MYYTFQRADFKKSSTLSFSIAILVSHRYNSKNQNAMEQRYNKFYTVLKQTYPKI